MTLRGRLITAGILALGASTLLLATGERGMRDDGSRQAAYRGASAAGLDGTPLTMHGLGPYAARDTAIRASWEGVFGARR